MKPSKLPNKPGRIAAIAPDQEIKRLEADPRNALDVMRLYLKNLDEVRRWYRNSSTPGIERGHVVLGEMFFTVSVEALSLALEGKSWSPGNRQP